MLQPFKAQHQMKREPETGNSGESNFPTTQFSEFGAIIMQDKWGQNQRGYDLPESDQVEAWNAFMLCQTGENRRPTSGKSAQEQEEMETPGHENSAKGTAKGCGSHEVSVVVTL